MAAAAETVKTAKTAAEEMSLAGNHAFKDAMEKSMTALAETSTHSKKNLEAMMASATAAAKGAEAVSAEAMAYTKKSVEEQMAAAKALAAAKSLQEAVELQTAFTKKAMESYMAEMTRMSEIFTASMKDSMKPINERVTATVERLQAAR
ncbi:TIGR01841 family phasin [Phenylobacterium sp.]|uniref:TIGR01841 family phasin n=1 Tax=Phenylobacterium sp. TaxID=1871053 RepID=UPI00272F4D99|nr:TIGR01841 family phasin [Phenylobacterium sp.]MDP2213644.1 TIGR01841 family phasin [Phenylobacterium sp.]